MMNCVDLCEEKSRRNFYPTPADLAQRLLSRINWQRVERVLEPSAGKGDLIQAAIDACSKVKYHNDLTIDAIEIDSNLRSVLNTRFSTTRDARVYIVHDDFLTFDGRDSYDLIIMNPPFESGDKHLLHALEIMEKSGGEICCILNANTLKNPFSNYRKLLCKKLDELEAKVEFLENAFSKSDRTTDVEIAVVHIRIPQPEHTSKIFERLQRAAEEHRERIDENDVTDLSVTDFLNDIVQRFKVERDAGLTLIREYKGMMPYILDNIESATYNPPILSLSIKGTNDINEAEYLRLTRLKYWKSIFANKAVTSCLTTNLVSEYRAVVNELSHYDFSLFNVQRVLREMNAKMAQSLEDTIVALFDELSYKHSWYPNTVNNIHYFDGWKTNTAHKVNTKVVLPVHTLLSYTDRFDVYAIVQTISDIEKTFNYLDGHMSAPVDLNEIIDTACNSGQTRNISCKYFNISIFKKGTIHIKFTNLELLRRFNIYCSQKKGWLPPDYGKKKYQDMSKEDQHVLDSFHGNGDAGSGADAYSKILNNPRYYLKEANCSLILGAES